MGNIYYNQKNYDKAFEFYLAAAEQDVAQAQYNVGVYYMNGIGSLEKDEIKSKEWLDKAHKNGSQDALNLLRRIEEQRILRQLLGQ